MATKKAAPAKKACAKACACKKAAAPAKAPAKKEVPQTKSAILAAVAEKAEISKKQAEAAYGALIEIAYEDAKKLEKMWQEFLRKNHDAIDGKTFNAVGQFEKVE